MHGNDAELDGGRIQAALLRCHAHDLVSWRDSAGLQFYCVLAQTEDDLFCDHLVHRGETARREPWQRANLILAIGPELNQVLWEAEHCPLPDAGTRQTLWFERVTSRYRIGPFDCTRAPGTGRPSWARPDFM